MTSFLSILAKSSGAIDQNLAVDKGNAGDVLISTTTGFSFVSPNTFTPNLSQVLLAGNTATNSINLNNIGVGTNVISLLPNVGVADPQITLTDGTTTNTINKSGYTTRNSVQNITHYLNFSDSSATGTGAIQKSTGIECNPSTKTITTTTFIGNLTVKCLLQLELHWLLLGLQLLRILMEIGNLTICGEAKIPIMVHLE